ncbi:MAG: hypothetical protein U5L11_02475 [Arhodomonas sp.]|nr:hypothetical protein [Arhodomonas sp.]
MDTFDVSLLGDKALAKQLEQLQRKDARRIIGQELRKSAGRTRTRVVANLSGYPVAVDTGVTRQAFRKAKIKSARARRGNIRLGIVLPERSELGISPTDKFYYPTAIEYGYNNVPARPFMRPAVDDHAEEEFRLIGAGIAAKITALWGRIR